MKFIIGKKLEMSEFWKDDGTVVPVTLIHAEPNLVVNNRVQEKDGYSAAVVGAFRAKRVNKAQKKMFEGTEEKKNLKEARNAPENWQKGMTLDLNQFQIGEKVEVTGISKGKGFQGVVKRHRFAGGPASHGHKDNLRMPGAIGSGGIQRVFKGLRMAGRMGADKVTVKNLEVIKIDPEKHVIALKGAVPGARGNLIVIKSLNN